MRKNKLKRNLIASIHNATDDYTRKMISISFNLVTIGSDQRFMGGGAKAVVEKLKGGKQGTDSKGY